MRLTKGQLKRIIREEYSRLKRRGLIREFGPVPGGEMDDFDFDEPKPSPKRSLKKELETDVDSEEDSYDGPAIEQSMAPFKMDPPPPGKEIPGNPYFPMETNWYFYTQRNGENVGILFSMDAGCYFDEVQDELDRKSFRWHGGNSYTIMNAWAEEVGTGKKVWSIKTHTNY